MRTLLKRISAICLAFCMMISMLSTATTAAENVIYVDDGSTVIINRVGTGSREAISFQTTKPDGSFGQYYNWPAYTLVVTNGKVTTGRPYFWNTSPPPERENMDSVLSCFTMDASSTLTTLQNAIYPTSSGKYGTPPIYSIYTPPDTTEPNLTLTQSTRSPTNLPVTITATATDNKAMHAIPFNFNGGGWGTSNTFIVTENGTYTAQARDQVGNIATRDITISNIDKLPPTFIINSLMSVGDGSKVLVAVMAQDNSMSAVQYSFDNGVTWQSDYTCELPVDVEVTIKVRDTVGNIASAKFIPRPPSNQDDGGNGGGAITPAISVVVENNTDLEKTIFGSTGIVNTAGNYQTYAAANRKPGIELKINVSSSAKDRFLSGAATFSGKDYPVHWNSASGPLVIPSAAATGYIFIDKSEFKGNYKNTRIRVCVGEYTDAAVKTKIAEGVGSVSTSVDTSPPIISVDKNRATNKVSIDTYDSISGVKDVLYSIDGGAYVRYTSPFVASAANRSITVVAVDKLENKSTETTPLLSSDVATDTITSNIYTYKSKSSIFYIVGGDKSNTKTVNLSDFVME